MFLKCLLFVEISDLFLPVFIPFIISALNGNFSMRRFLAEKYLLIKRVAAQSFNLKAGCAL